MDILLDPGHGGSDCGALGNGLRECDINLAVSFKVAAIAKDAGLQIGFTRKLDMTMGLSSRVAAEHRLEPLCFVSIHCNAVESQKANGWEIWTSPGETDSDRLATCVSDALRAALPDLKWREDFSDGDMDKEGHLYVCTQTAGPAILVEMGFISNADDAAWIADEHCQWAVAQAICDGVAAWLG